MFEMRPTQELIQIALAGGGFTIKASMRPTQELIMLANAAAQSGATLTLCGLTMRSTNELLMIAQAGRGRIVFAD